MAIVRSLLIRLGFVTDKQAINQTNRAITGFKTRFAIAASAATFAFNKVKNFFSDLASSILDTEDFAKRLKVPIDELIGLQKAASNYRIDTNQFYGGLNRINDLLQEAKSGYGELRKMSRELGFEIDYNSSINTFLNILERLRNLSTDESRNRIAENIFGKGIGQRFASLAKDLDAYKESAKQAASQSIISADQIEALKEYEKSVNALSMSWDSFVLTLSKTVVPALTGFLKYIEFTAKSLQALFTLDFEGLRELYTNSDYVKNFSRAFDEFSVNVISKNINDELFETAAVDLANAFESFKEWVDPIYREQQQEKRGPYQYMQTGIGIGSGIGAGAFSPSVINNIDISVPPGTSQEQTNYITSEIKEIVDSAIYEQYRVIQNNNPRIE